jgi:hypothetical protein
VAGGVYLLANRAGTWEAFAMTDQKFATLKQKLQQEPNHADVMLYFFDHFADHQAFIKMSQPVSDEQRQKSICAVLLINLQVLLGKPNVALIDPFVLAVPKHRLLHGAFLTEGMSVGAFFYFEDIDSGLVGVSGGRLGDQLLSARFTLNLLPLSTE